MFRYRLLNRSWKSVSERDLEFLRRKKWAKKRNKRVKNRKKSPEPRVVVFLGLSKLAKAKMLNFK
jgi:hypothetical protein